MFISINNIRIAIIIIHVILICSSVPYVQVAKSVKAILSHHDGGQLMEQNDQWGRSYLHHAAAAVGHHVTRYFV